MAEVEVNRLIQEQIGVTSLAQNLVQMLSSDEMVEDAKKSAETIASVREKVSKGKSNVDNTIKGLEQKVLEVQNGIALEYSKSVPNGEPKSSVDELKEELIVTRRELKDKVRDSKKLEKEQKVLNYHRKHQRLQKRVAAIHFDLASTDTHVKGYLKKASGDLQVFEFDFAEDGQCYASDFLWDSI